MLFHTNIYEGLPTRLYRRPSEIQADIMGVKEKVSEIEKMLSIREFLLNLVTENENKKPELWIPELEDALETARIALDDLNVLNETLVDLRAELGDVQCAMRI